MTLEKINHSLFKVFVLLLVLTQGMIFVTTRAAFEQSKIFDVQFNLASQSITSGEEVALQAKITSTQPVNTVYFVLQNVETRAELQIQAYLENDNLWQADSSWDTINYLPGKYHLTILASFYDSAGTLLYSKNSDPAEIELLPSFKTASVVATEQDNSKDQGAATEEVQVTTTALEAQLVLPQKGEDISQANQEIVATVNRALDTTETLGASLYNIDGVLISSVILEANNSTSTLSYSAKLEDASQHPVGEYYFVLWLNEKTNFLTDPVVVAVKAKTAEDNQDNTEDLNNNSLVTDPVDYQISLVEPKTESFINDQEVSFSFQTNFIADTFGFLLVNESDASIGDEYQISKFDGLTWSKKINLSSDFINAKYVVAAIATDPSGVVYEESFSFILDLATSSSTVSVEAQETDKKDDVTATSSPDLVSEKTEDDLTLEKLKTEDLNWLENPSPEETTKAELVNADLKTNQDCANNGFTSAADCTQWLKTENNNLDQMCLDEEIDNAEACEDYLNRTVVDLTCQQAQIFDPQACHSYLLEKYTADVSCLAIAPELCRQALAENYLNRLVVKKLEQAKINEKIEPLIGQNTSLQNLAKLGLSAEDLALDVSQNLTTSLFVAPAQKATVLNQQTKLESVPAAILLIDSDQDGLADDLEKYFGTDPFNQDSDGDGYFDAVEIRNNYNPLGEGVLAQKFTSIARIMLSGLPLQQPKTNQLNIDASWQSEVNSVAENTGLNLSGQAEPNSLVTIYIYSNVPLVLNTMTDRSGHWDYQLAQNLTDGEHEMYVTSYDEQGQIVKQSAGKSFFVKKAQAVSAGSYFDSNTQTASTQKSNLVYYLLALAALVFVSLGVFVYARGSRE